MKKLLLLFILFLNCAVPRTLQPPSSDISVGGGMEIVGDNIIINKDTTIRKGTYLIEDLDRNGVIYIVKDNVTLDFNGATLDGKDFEGMGIVVENRQKVTIKNAKIKGFFYGILANGCSELTIINNDISNNFNNPKSGWIWPLSPDTSYGGGMLLKNCHNNLISDNLSTNNMIGIDLIYSDYNLIRKNQATHNSIWGIHLYHSGHNRIVENKCDHNIRYSSRYCPEGGCESAGILLEEFSNENLIHKNSATHSGDGIFIRSNPPLHCSQDNIISYNDGSFSPHNAFEATFCYRNHFYNNIATNSDYGFWLGHLHESQIKNNIIKDNQRDGIAMPRASLIEVTDNEISGNYNGIHIWGDSDDIDLPNKAESNAIINNKISENRNAGIYLRKTKDNFISENEFLRNRCGIYKDIDSEDNIIETDNQFKENEQDIKTR